MKSLVVLALGIGFLSTTAIAQTNDRIQLETIEIRANTELPKYLYVVPWQDRKSTRRIEQRVVLHNLYGDLFDPVLPAYIPEEKFEMNSEREKK
ncbi:hypothetical protein DWB84_11435 [Saccharophagus sp. K07]|jgi:hypothetical protein|uniref:hypothetical protein n=1 Tax=Saccharophagus sp. K07 TaxID=2283636 RepID=UPI0016523DD1|nr:hypothetical protein [Saccharophagus sp. K07]MBC6906071.1 hypothetical protein [Saccharophagus sp. K07]